MFAGLLRSPSNVFAALAAMWALLSLLTLLAWSDGNLASLEWIGILGWAHALALVVVSTLAAKLWGWLLFRGLSGSTIAAALAGAAVAALVFLTVVMVHGVILATVVSSALAFAAMLATMLFGGLAFGLPAAIVAAIVGAVMARRGSRQVEHPAAAN